MAQRLSIVSLLAALAVCLSCISYEAGATGAVGGIGAVIQVENGQAVVLHLIQGMPASKGGLYEQDKIVEIDGRSVSGKSVEEVLEMISGPFGTDVDISVEHAWGGSARMKLTRVYMTQLDPAKRLVEYEKTMTPLRRAVTLAELASMCRLRSEGWYQNVADAVATTRISEAKRLALSNDEIASADAEGNRAAAKARSDYPMDGGGKLCRDLLNSSEMTRLDQLQQAVTGNYH